MSKRHKGYWHDDGERVTWALATEKVKPAPRKKAKGPTPAPALAYWATIDSITPPVPKPRKKAPYVAKVGRGYVVGLQSIYAIPVEIAADGRLMSLFHLTPKQARELQALLEMVVEPAKANIPASKPAKRQNTGTKGK